MTATSDYQCLRAKAFVSKTWVGTLLYVVVIATFPFPLTTCVVLLAAFVIVPIVLDFAVLRSHNVSRTLAFIGWIQIPAAVLLTLGYASSTGTYAGLYCLPWAILTLTLAAYAVLRVYRRRSQWWDPEQLGIDVGLLMSAIGGVWAFFFRFGRWPADYPAIVAELTAVHFHYAGLVLPIIVGSAAARLPGKSGRCLVPMLAAATLLLAAGITFSPLLEWSAAVALILVATITALVQLRSACISQRPLALMLLAISAVSLLTGMALASIYATGEWTGSMHGQAAYTGGGWISIPQMIQLHGTFLAFGFAIPALVGWNLTRGLPFRNRTPRRNETRRTVNALGSQ